MKRLASSRKGTSIIVPSAKISPVVIDSACKDDHIPSDTEAGFQYMLGLTSTDKYWTSLPPIVLKHQIYSIIKDKTVVDRELMLMRNNGKIRLIKLDSGSNDYAVLSTDHYHTLITDRLGSSPLCQKVINNLLPKCVDVSVTIDQLTKDFCFSSNDISTLVKKGLLLVRDVGKQSSWWYTIPAISIFKTDFAKGRNAIKQMFKRAKNNEILQKDLESKKLSCSCLPIEYFIHDLIGSEAVESITTSSGPLLKLAQ